MIRTLKLLAGVSLFIAIPLAAQAGQASVKATVTALSTGELTSGAAALTGLIAGDPSDNDARLGLGMVRFVQAVEQLSQGFYRYGLRAPNSMMVPIVRLPVPDNPDPEPIDYDKFRALLVAFSADLNAVDAALAGMSAADAKIPIDLPSIRYDANGDGVINYPAETLAAAMARFMGVPPGEMIGASMDVGFDRADAIWLRGYCHVLMALNDFLLAHDWRESFDASFHVFFPRAHSPFQEALAPPEETRFGSEVAIADLISFLHIRWPVTEPERMASARTHLKQVIRLSRENWAAILAETDNDREWLPGPGQTGVTGATVNSNEVAAWNGVLDEVDALLDGRTLLPHWRFNQGINLRRIFDEPRPFDFVLWITGPAALPYLEDGPILTTEEWSDVTAAFEGEFGSYAIWFN